MESLSGQIGRTQNKAWRPVTIFISIRNRLNIKK
jgi:hypothetical protein